MTSERICPECGAVVADGESFCSVCGAYVAWDSAAAGSPTAPIGRAGIPSDGAGAGAGAMTAGPFPGPTAGPSPAPTPIPSTPGATTPAAAAAVPTVAMPAARADPAEVRPDAAPARPRNRPTPTAPVTTPVVHPGDIRCLNCGTGNPPGRSFCQHCGQFIVGGAGANGAPVYAAGERQKRRRRFPVVLLVVLIVVVVAIVAGLIFRHQVVALAEGGLDRVLATKQETPTLTASSQQSAHPAGAAHDGYANQYWAPVAGAAAPTITASFAHPFRLVYLQIYTGVSDQKPQFLAGGRATALTVTTTSTTGEVQKTTLNLDDKAGAQQFELGIDDVRSVAITITKSSGTSASVAPAIAELDFVGR